MKYQTFFPIKTKRNIGFRLASRQDLLQYFQWANDSTTRKQSFDSNPISLKQHHKWFNTQLQDPNVKLILMLINGESVGQIRFNIQSEQATINYSIDKENRGKGLAKHLISGGIHYLKMLNPQITKVNGYVKRNNLPSIKTFQSIGFQEQIDAEHITQIQYYTSFEERNN